MKIRTEIINKERAQELMLKNKRNRRINNNQVIFLCKEIKQGRWMENGETIKFDINGNLIDGQHRLQAIISTDSSIKCTIAYDLSPDAFNCIDTNRVRTTQDILSAAGMKNHTAIASTCKKILHYRNMGFDFAEKGAPKTSHDVVLDLLDKEPDICKSVEYVSNKKKIKRLAPPSELAVIHYFLSAYNKIEADLFFDDFNKNQQSSISQNLTRVLLDKKLKGIKVKTLETYAYFFRAFELHLKRESISRIIIPKKDDFVKNWFMQCDQRLTHFGKNLF